MHQNLELNKTTNTDAGLPNLIIAGVNKAATTSLFMYLSSHPDICPSRTKEVQYFLPLRYGKELAPIGEYLNYFSHCHGAKYRMEATGGYFYGGKAVAEAIREQLHEVKIFISIREPISRLYSYYKFKKGSLELNQDISFEEYIRLCEDLPLEERKRRKNNVYWGINGGFYADYIEDWFAVFNQDEIRFVFFDDLVNDPRTLLRELCLWLDIEHETFIDSLDLSVENRTMNYKNRNLQKVALLINWHGESFWRTRPRLKRKLRQIYYAINGLTNTERIAEETYAYLRTVYGVKNARLATQLRAHGYSDLPDWLSVE